MGGVEGKLDCSLGGGGGLTSDGRPFITCSIVNLMRGCIWDAYSPIDAFGRYGREKRGGSGAMCEMCFHRVWESSSLCV